jgi:1-aminocyclopropane-1-carboxylate deaminase
VDKQLITFKNKFEKEFTIPLDYIYTNKLFYAAFDLIKQNKIKPNSKILIIHCGGLQGNKGFEERYKLG